MIYKHGTMYLYSSLKDTHARLATDLSINEVVICGGGGSVDCACSILSIIIERGIRLTLMWAVSAGIYYGLVRGANFAKHFSASQHGPGRFGSAKHQSLRMSRLMEAQYHGAFGADIYTQAFERYCCIVSAELAKGVADPSVAALDDYWFDTTKAFDEDRDEINPSLNNLFV